MGNQLSLLDTKPPEPTAIPLETPKVRRSAEMSLCLKYRYRLSRCWGSGSAALFVMCNPSSGDDQQDDPTILRCIAFATAWGHGSLEIVNLFAFRSPHPDALYDVVDPIGPNNDTIIREAAKDVVRGGGRLVAAWGASVRFDDLTEAAYRGRDRKVLEILKKYGPIWCLGKTATGAPKHPLARGKHRVPDDFQLEAYT
jgi:hypothetical protein